jgi:predicted nucleic acid-binding protein
MNGKIIFDTNTLLNFFKGKIDRNTFMETVSGSLWFVSVVTRMELFAYSKLPADEEAEIRKFLKDCKVIPLNRRVEREAINFKRDTHRKLPDAIIAATAIVLDATLVTRDGDLLDRSWPGLETFSIR